MKNIFRFAVAALSVVLSVYSTVSCESDNDDTLSVSRKQWIAEIDGEGVFLDIGFMKVGTAFYGDCNLKTLEGTSQIFIGEYTIAYTDATSGSINVNSINEELEEEVILKFKYKNLTDSSVSIDSGILSGSPTGEYITFSLALKAISIDHTSEAE